MVLVAQPRNCRLESSSDGKLDVCFTTKKQWVPDLKTVRGREGGQGGDRYVLLRSPPQSPMVHPVSFHWADHAVPLLAAHLFCPLDARLF